MNRQDPPSESAASGAAGRGRWSTTDADKVKARKFFDHAKKSAETRNYDYAIKLYVAGLALWPDAVDEGLKPLRVVATGRRLEGKKPAGFLAARKLTTSGKDTLKNLNNALHLFGLDPVNVGHMENILKLSAKAGIDRVTWWIAPVLVEAFDTGKKLSPDHYAEACAAMESAADLAEKGGEDQIAMDIFGACIAAAQIWGRLYPDSIDAQRARSNASGKVTIVKGKFAKEGGFTQSLKDAQAQQDIRDRDRLMQTDERMRDHIERARQEWQKNRDVPSKLLNLVEMMLRVEGDELEEEALKLLEAELAATGNYVFRMKADDIRMRRMSRRRRELTTAVKNHPDDSEAQHALAEESTKQVAAEIAIFEDRIKQYPTEARLKFELAARLFQARRFDDAIPLFQQSQLDGRLRGESRLFIGRCFYEKNFGDQAVRVLRQATEELDAETGKLPLELNYWLARSLEKTGQVAEARKVYGHLIQIDYNYRDARQRLERLVAETQP